MPGIPHPPENREPGPDRRTSNPRPPIVGRVGDPVGRRRSRPTIGIGCALCSALVSRRLEACLHGVHSRQRKVRMRAERVPGIPTVTILGVRGETSPESACLAPQPAVHRRLAAQARSPRTSRAVPCGPGCGNHRCAPPQAGDSRATRLNRDGATSAKPSSRADDAVRPPGSPSGTWSRSTHSEPWTRPHSTTRDCSEVALGPRHAAWRSSHHRGDRPRDRGHGGSIPSARRSAASSAVSVPAGTAPSTPTP